MAKPFYQMLADTMIGTLGRNRVRASQEDIEEMARKFEDSGGSWYRLAHGNPPDLEMYRGLAVEALRYQSGKGENEKE